MKEKEVVEEKCNNSEAEVAAGAAGAAGRGVQFY